MYTAFYDLKLKPFQISSDPSFIWLGEKHKEALAVLRYGILDNKGFLLLTGDVGTGKTTLLNTLVASLGDDVIYASVPDPRLVKIEFFNYIADAFGIEGTFKTKGKFLKIFSQFLRAACNNNKKVLLLIDESQLLTQDLLEEIRLLSNIEMPKNQMLNIFFVGQNEFNEVISRPENRAVAQRLTLNYYLEPLSLHETEQYILHRLKIAGTEKKIFSSGAIREIYTYSGGFPRRINVICDHCLLTGYVKEKNSIDAGIVTDCARELEIPKYTKIKQQKERPSRLPQPLPSTPSQEIVPESPTPQQIVQQAGPRSAEPEDRRSKSRRLLVALLVGGLLLALSSLVFPEFFSPYYRNAAAYITTLRAKLQGTGTKSRLPAPPAAGEGNLAEATNKGTNISVSPPPATPLTGQQTEPAQDSQERGAISGQKGDDQVDAIPSSEQAGSLAAATSPPPVRTTRQAATKSAEIRTKSPIIIEDDQTAPFFQEKLVVRFVHDSNYFNAPDIEKLKDFAQRLIAHPKTMALIAGYTDSTGSERYNVKLSEFRANIVRGFLLGQGVPPEQMKSEGRGTQNPIDSNDTVDGRRLNRRVEITVFPR
ncbi:MAG: AAA family ATPase [Desulforhopalus sp.]